MTLRPDCIHESIQFNSGDYYVTCRGCNAQWPIREKRSMRPDPQELKRLVEELETANGNLGMAITKSREEFDDKLKQRDAVRTALWAALGIAP